ncbi:monocarboxylate transporter 12-like [Glandiceps talaboti]
MALLTPYFDDRFAFVNGMAGAGVALAYSIYSPLCQAIINNYGWRGTLLICSAVNANLGVCAALMRPPKNTYECMTRDGERDQKISTDLDTHAQSQKSVGSNCLESFLLCSGCWLFRKYRLLIIIMITIILGEMGFSIILFLLMPDAVNKGIPKMKSAFLVPIIGIASLISSILQGFITDKHYCSSLYILAIAMLTKGISVFCVPWMNSFELLVCAAAVIGLCMGIYYPVLYVTIKEIVGAQNYAVGVGFAFFFCGIGYTVGPPIGGLLYDVTASYDYSFIFAAILNILCAILFVIVALKQRNNKHSEN